MVQGMAADLREPEIQVTRGPAKISPKYFFVTLIGDRTCLHVCVWMAINPVFARKCTIYVQVSPTTHPMSKKIKHSPLFHTVLLTPLINQVAWYDRTDATRPILMAFCSFLMRLAHHAANAVASKFTLPCANTPSFHFSRPMTNALWCE